MYNMDLIQRYQSKNIEDLLVFRFNNFDIQIPYIYLILIIELLIYFINNQYIIMIIRANIPVDTKAIVKSILKNLILLLMISISIGVITKDISLGILIGCGIGIITFSILIILKKFKN